MNNKPRVLVLCCPGLYQRYLALRIAEQFNLVGLVRQSTPAAKGSFIERFRRYNTPIKLFRYLSARKCIFQYETKARALNQKLFYRDGQAPFWPNVSIIDVWNVNDDRVVQFIQERKPDLLCINGTNLLREPILKIIPNLPLGALNMHTGLSPYARGGNCNLFMLLEGHPEFVGVTIHHISPAIDGGDIVISARPELDPDDNFEMIEAKVFHSGIELMLVAIRQLMEGRAARIKQWEKGKLFLRKTGYQYEPYLRVQVNDLIRKGLLREYLLDKDARDANVKLIGEAN